MLPHRHLTGRILAAAVSLAISVATVGAQQQPRADPPIGPRRRHRHARLRRRRHQVRGRQLLRFRPKKLLRRLGVVSSGVGRGAVPVSAASTSAAVW